MDLVRRAVAGRVEAALGAGGVGGRPLGEPGLFGPGSASRAVHGDVGAMLVGGVAALLLQMLHPGALAGVWDHSDFRRDMAGRLRRTARFLAVCTYGTAAEAEAAAAAVRRIHGRVRGRLPDGSAYAADDPALLAWVHAAATHCFLRAHLRYRDPWFPAAEQDRYLREQARVARMLGAGDVPESRAELAAHLRRARPELRADARTREVARLILTPARRGPASDPVAGPLDAVVRRAGADLLPPWAARMHGIRLSWTQAGAARAGALGAAAALRWAMARDAAGARPQAV